MFDIHSHILPSTDDGARDIEESLEMARLAYKNGIEVMVATPHYIEGEGSKNYKYNQELLDILNNELKKRKIDVDVFLGNEVFITPNILMLLNDGEITTLNKSRYLLLELPTLDIPIFIEELIYTLRLRGLIPVIAHPERNLRIIDDPNILYNMIIRGCLSQIDITSILGLRGAVVKKTAEILINSQMCHVISTDSHSSHGVLFHFKNLMEKLYEKMEPNKIYQMLHTNPRTIVLNKVIDIEYPKKYKPPKKLKYKKNVPSY